MSVRRAVRAIAAAALLVGVVALPGPAHAQTAGTNFEFLFSGTAQVGAGCTAGEGCGDGIFYPGLDTTDKTDWNWNFRSSTTCLGSGLGAGNAIAGPCELNTGGALLPDLTEPGQPLADTGIKNAPYCGNSRGQSNFYSFSDPSGTIWSGELHWDGVLRGDPSYSLGSQLLLFGDIVSDTGEQARMILFLNASGGSNCAPQISATGATSFTVNGVGSIGPR